MSDRSTWPSADHPIGHHRQLIQENPMPETEQHTVEAAPFEARQCPICKLWIFTAAGPFGEDDDITKTLADYYHWEATHATAQQLNTPSFVAFPYFQYNDEPVKAMLREPLTRTAVITLAKLRSGYDPVDTPCEPRRSAYSDGPLGDRLFTDGQYRWTTFKSLMLRFRDLLTDTDLWTLGAGEPMFDWAPDTPLDQAIGEAIGAGSVCWEHVEAAGVFDSERATRIVDEVMAFIRAKQLGIES